MEFGVVLVFMFLLFFFFIGGFIGVIVVCVFQQVYICLLLLYIIIVYFLFYVSSPFVWLLCNKIIFLMLFYCFIVCFHRLSYVFVWWCTYFLIEKSDFSSLGFFSVLECSYSFSCFCFCQSCAKFIQTSAFF